MPAHGTDRPDHLNRLAAFERARLGVELGPALDRNHQRPLDVLFGGDDVAHAQADQVGRRDVRLGQVDDHLDHGVAQLAADPLDVFRRGRFLAVADPAVGRQPRADPLDRVERNAQVHHAAGLAERQLEADQHDHFVRRHDLHQLRIALHAIDRQVRARARFPRRASSPCRTGR